MQDITLKALIKRINRRLAHQYQALKITRGTRWLHDLGHYYVIDCSLNAIIDTHCDLTSLARELGVLGTHERVVDSQGTATS